jgi:plastocyanin
MAVRRAAVAWAAGLVISCGMLALPLVAYAATFAVSIQGFAYAPNPVTIRVGDTVTWTNQDDAQHSARFAGRPSTQILSKGQSGSIPFTIAGSFPYDCAVHGSAMQGTVVVQAATPAPTPPPTAPPATPPPAPSTPLPTPVRTAAPTPAPTAPRTAAPTNPPTAAPTETQAAASTQNASASPTSAAVETLTVAASPSAVAVQVTPAPAAGGSPAPLLIGVAALAVVALGAIAFFLTRRT